MYLSVIGIGGGGGGGVKSYILIEVCVCIWTIIINTLKHRNDAPGPAIANCVHALLKMIDSGPSRLSLLDPVNDLRINNMEFVELKEEMNKLEGTMQHYNCTHCPHFSEHVSTSMCVQHRFLHHEIWSCSVCYS